ncbi:DNA-binding protein [Burkholderia gladioli]|uniref:DNA-binding protein n=1 Tax=Burkholderia gladioli TaxID=28095 RepID=A0AB38U5X6_BURGA|nr:DNA-binding protein [Burkholderia gladioli]UWX75351.1 DNA-binding protein [Burkholderia gladioli]
MNAIPLHAEVADDKPSSVIVEKLDAIRRNKKRKSEVAQAVGWSDDMMEKVFTGTGVVAEKMGPFLAALGLVVTTKEYMDYLARGNVIGSNCHCARANMGECGRR